MVSSQVCLKQILRSSGAYLSPSYPLTFFTKIHRFPLHQGYDPVPRSLLTFCSVSSLDSDLKEVETPFSSHALFNSQSCGNKSMLTLEEREIAEKALALAISRRDQPRAVLLAMVAEDDFSLTFPLHAKDVRDLAREAIKMCEDSKWDRLPPWLQQILSKIAETSAIKKILDKIATPPPDWKTTLLPNSFDAFWLSRLGLPFVNRLKLRESLRRLNAPTGPSVLIINGPARSGKSYSVELLYHAVEENIKPSEKNALVPVIRITLQPGMGASLTAETLAQLIVSRITSKPKPLPILDADQDIVTSDRMNEHLCDWIVDNAVESGAQWWVALDGLNDPDLTPTTRNFISKIVELLSDSGKHSKKLRLLIIDYPLDQLTGVSLDKTEMEQLGPIGDVDVESFLKQQLEEFGGAAPPDQAVRTGVILAMLNLPEDGSRLQALNDRLKVVVTNLSKEK